MAISEKTRKIIWARSGNRCSICKTELVLQKDPFGSHLNIGEECHIISRQPNGPRHQNISGFNYDSSDNLLLLCCNHHKEVDEKVKSFPVDELKRIKSEHELWVKSNLDGNYAGEVQEMTRLNELINFVTAKHDIKMNTSSSKQLMASQEGLQLAFQETEKIKKKIYEIVSLIRNKAPNYSIVLRDNRNRITDILFDGFTLLAQFYQSYTNVAVGSYILFAVVDGYFDERGYADAFNKATIKEVIRLDFAFNEKGEPGWLEQERKKDFYLSDDITEIWIDKYFKTVLNSEKKRG